jgi:hypothetical protein
MPWSLKIAEARRSTEEEIKKTLICKYNVNKNQSIADLVAFPKQQCARFIIPTKQSE